MKKERFLTQFPGKFFLDKDDLVGLQVYVEHRGWLQEGEVLQSAEKAGEGNMNCTLRLRTTSRTLILKQARPWVEKYPQIEAPVERAVVEAHFYACVQTYPEVAHWMPRILGVDDASFVLLMEDLGDGSDLSSLYRVGQSLQQGSLDFLADFLASLHRLSFSEEVRASLSNRSMRALNHEHLFALPIRPNNGIDLDGFVPGLAGTAKPLLQEQAFCSRIQELGDLYLADGTQLLHGDFYPGSWLKQDEDVYILDPEFSFFGPASFDVGVCLAHLMMSQHAEDACQRFLQRYLKTQTLDLEQTMAFAGVEITRRLLGVAQLPLCLDLSERVILLQKARTMVFGDASFFKR